MEVFTTIAQVREFVGAQRRAGRSIGFVPTMGALHEGHLSLMRRAREECDVVVISIFVNPTQFGPSEDLDRYPRDLERDLALLEREGTDVVFAPDASDMYPDGYSTVVHVQRLGDRLCGAFRPGHFDGVCTVVAKLFEIVRPNVAVFGQKDGQQAAIIERMAADLDMDVQIVRGPIVREPDGLAMSSRNGYLTAEERAEAPVLHEALERARALFEAGETDVEKVLGEVRAMIDAKPHAEVQYVEAVDWRRLSPVSELRPGAMIAVAVFFGATRLIDNIVLGETG